MKVTADEVEAALSEFVMKDVLLRKTPLDRNEDLFDAGFDSLSLSRVLVFIEQRFGVVIPDQDVVIDEMATIASMAKFVHGYLGTPGE